LKGGWWGIGNGGFTEGEGDPPLSEAGGRQMRWRVVKGAVDLDRGVEDVVRPPLASVV